MMKPDAAPFVTERRNTNAASIAMTKAGIKKACIMDAKLANNRVKRDHFCSKVWRNSNGFF